MPSPLREQIRALEIEERHIRKQLLGPNRQEWSIALARLQVVFSELEQYYAAMAVECYSELRPAKKDNVLDCTVAEGKH
jgi:hypothetical protein